MASPTQQAPEAPQESTNSPLLLPNSTPSAGVAAIATPKFNYPSFSELLEGVVKAANSASALLHPVNPSLGNVCFKGQFGMSHQEALASVTAKAAQVQFPSGFLSSTPDASPVNKPQLSVLVVSDVGLMKTPVPETKAVCEGDNKISSDQINSLGNDGAKTPNSDGYSWRKYGQKQVKSSESFRSYYRCTHAGCHTKKKVLHADKSGCITAVDYKGLHNHDPPTKIKEKILKPPRTADGGPVSKTKNVGTDSAKMQLGDADISATVKVKEQVVSVDDRSEPEKSSKCHITTSTGVEEQEDKKPDCVPRVIVQQPTALPEEPSRPIETNEHIMTDTRKETVAPSGQKRRMKDRAREYSEKLQKAPKQTKIVVHAAGDVGISTDGYRWRKYGQKVVKGNSHPRSYYRCTSAGCPARKHVEKATDNSIATTVTYESKHDHDKPVPKKHHATENSPAEKTTEVKGTDKVIESARTLLSIGIELKSC